MKISEALGMIAAQQAEAARVARGGYRVSFQRRERNILSSDHFPERDEEPIDTEDEAWRLAREFAACDPRGANYVNIYVIKASDWAPVDGYSARKMNEYPRVVDGASQDRT